MNKDTQIIDKAISQEYEYGFTTNIQQETIPPGLSENVIRLISSKKNEPKWLLDWRLKAYQKWLKMEEPDWSKLNYSKIDFQSISYYAAPKPKEKLSSLDEVDPELLKTYEKLGISISEQKKLTGVAVDIVVDSVSVATTFRDTLSKKGIIFCSISEAIKKHSNLVKKYIGTVVPQRDNFYSALNSAVFSRS